MHTQTRATAPVPQSVAGPHFDVLVVGAGFAGLYMLHRLRGLGFSVRVYEAGGGVGGTWYWNRYPGARCDVESMEYSYQFSEELQQEWSWGERYAAQPEILSYANHVADRYDLRRDIQFNTRVEAAAFEAGTNRWSVRIAANIAVNTATSASSTEMTAEMTAELTAPVTAQVTAQFLVMATGCLSTTNLPGLPGRECFTRDWYHTGAWPHEAVDFSGKRVGIIGTGSSAIQSIPIIAQQAEQLYVFQRTPNYSIPARNGPLDRELERAIKAEYPQYRERNSKNPGGLSYSVKKQLATEVAPEVLAAEFQERWEVGGLSFLRGFKDLLKSEAANAAAAEFVRERIRETVDDPETARVLSPKQIIGCKRLCLDTGYYQTFNRSNVTLIDISESPLEEITETAICAHGKTYEVDAIVFATGFDAMTGTLQRIDIRGRDGLPLREKWAAGPRTYLGLSTVGFPNLFTITGPGSPSVLSNMLPAIEQHVNWIADCLAYLRASGWVSIEPTLEAEDEWVAHVNQVANTTLYPHCNSWYLGANVPGKPRVFLPYIGYPEYLEKCKEVVANGYQGFRLKP